MEKIMDKELKELISVELDRVFKKAFMLTDKDIKKYIVSLYLSKFKYIQQMLLWNLQRHKVLLNL